MMKSLLLFLFTALMLCSCHRKSFQGSGSENGLASYYSESYNGKKTANGEIFQSSRLTAAHKKLAFGTRVRVTNLSNGKSVKVKINDRGPFVTGRIIDLSRAAARKIDMINEGMVKVNIRY